MDSSALLIATAWAGQQHRFMGLDWSYLTLLGLTGNAMFSTRFLMQWIASERKGESVVPVAFWYWSIGGSVILGLYFILQREPVGILSTLPNCLIYFRNLHLIRRGEAAAAGPRAPKETSAKEALTP